MTISIRSETGSFGTTNATTGVFTVPKPSNIQDNDYLVVIIGKQDEPNISPPTGTGWVIGNQLGSATGNDRWGGIYYKKITGSSGEPASYSFDSEGTSEVYGCWSMALSGVNQTTPEDVSFGGAGAWAALSNNQTPNAPAVTVVSNEAMAFACWAVNAATGTMPGGSWNTRVSNLNNGALFLASQTFSTSGTSTGAPEIALVNATQESMVGMFVFRPAETTFSNSVSLGINKGITESSIASGTASESLPVSKALATTSTQSSSNSFALPASKGLQTSSEKIITASLELSSELGLGSSLITIISDIILSANSIFSENISLDRVSNLSDVGQLSGTNSIALANTLALQLSSDIPTTTDVILSLSDNISESGTTLTTAQLTPPSGKTTADFTAGRISDDTNPLPVIDIEADRYTELEWSIEFTNNVQYSDQYEFRVTITGSALTSYIETPLLTVLVAGVTYTGTVDLDRTLFFSTNGLLSGIGNIELDKTLFLSNSGGLSVVGNIALNKILGLLVSSSFVQLGTLSLDKDLGFTNASQLLAVSTIGLGNILGLIDNSQLSGINTLSLGKYLSLANTSQLSAIANINLSKTLAFIASGGLLFGGSLSLNKLLTLTNSGLLSANNTLLLNKTLSLSDASQLSANGSLNLNKLLSLANTSQLLGINNITLSKVLGLTQSGFVGTIVIGSVSLIKNLGITDASQLNAVNSIGYGKVLGVSDGSIYSGGVAFSLGKALGITLTSSATLLGTISVGLNLSLTTSGIISAHLVLASMSLGKTLGLTDTSQLNAVGSINFTRVTTLADGSTQTANVSSALGKVLAVTVNANGTYNVTVDLPETLAILLSSFLIPVTPVGEGSLIISDELYYTITIWDETISEFRDVSSGELVIRDI